MTYGQEHKPPFPEPRNHDEEAQNAFAARDSAERESMTPRPANAFCQQSCMLIIPNHRGI